MFFFIFILWFKIKTTDTYPVFGVSTLLTSALVTPRQIIFFDLAFTKSRMSEPSLCSKIKKVKSASETIYVVFIVEDHIIIYLIKVADPSHVLLSARI